MQTADNALCWAMVEMGRLGTDCLFRKRLAIDHLSLLKELEKEVKPEMLYSDAGFSTGLVLSCHQWDLAVT